MHSASENQLCLKLFEEFADAFQLSLGLITLDYQNQKKKCMIQSPIFMMLMAFHNA